MPGSTDGISRRELIKRGAAGGAVVVAGGLVWAAPSVRGLGHDGAFAAPGSPRAGISFITVTFRCGSTTYRAKYEVDEARFDAPNPRGEPDGCEPPGYRAAVTHPDPESVLSVQILGSELCVMSTGDCTMVDGRAKSGSEDGSGSHASCRPPSSSSADRLCFQPQ